MSVKTDAREMWAAVEIMFARSPCYNVTHIHSAVAYKIYNGMMHAVVGDDIQLKCGRGMVLTHRLNVTRHTRTINGPVCVASLNLVTP